MHKLLIDDAASSTQAVGFVIQFLKLVGNTHKVLTLLWTRTGNTKLQLIFAVRVLQDLVCGCTDGILPSVAYFDSLSICLFGHLNRMAFYLTSSFKSRKKTRDAPVAFWQQFAKESFKVYINKSFFRGRVEGVEYFEIEISNLPPTAYFDSLSIRLFGYVNRKLFIQQHLSIKEK